MSEVAALIGVSGDTVRRWVDSGRLPAARDPHGHRVVDGAELAAFMRGGTGEDPERHRSSARDRFRGLVTDVTLGDVMAQVEIQAGPHRVVSLMSREAAEELGLEPGSVATAVLTSPRAEARGFLPSRAGVPVSQPTAARATSDGLTPPPQAFGACAPGSRTSSGTRFFAYSGPKEVARGRDGEVHSPRATIPRQSAKRSAVAALLCRSPVPPRAQVRGILGGRR